MKEKQLALSEEQMQNLTDLGCDVSSASMRYYHLKITDEPFLAPFHTLNPFFGIKNYKDEELAFTLEDIIELLPTHLIWTEDLDLLKNRVPIFNDRPKVCPLSINFQDKRFEYQVYGWEDVELTIPYTIEDTGYILSDELLLKGDTLLDAAYKMLCWLLENNLIDKK